MVLHPEQFDPDQFRQRYVNLKNLVGVDFSPNVVHLGKKSFPSMHPYFHRSTRFENGPRNMLGFEIPNETGAGTFVEFETFKDEPTRVHMGTNLGNQPNTTRGIRTYLDARGVVDGDNTFIRYSGMDDLHDALRHHSAELNRLLRSGEVTVGAGQRDITAERFKWAKDNPRVHGGWYSHKENLETINKSGYFEFDSDKFYPTSRL